MTTLDRPLVESMSLAKKGYDIDIHSGKWQKLRNAEMASRNKHVLLFGSLVRR